ncbi:MAG TPA: hypothetical protein DCR81_03650 [Smithella sp.]|jgi:TM2 domain-containing membrane protein YozV|nr:hypothetical protein [Smithella sp.]
MYCTNCGNEVAEKAIACTKCGVPPRAEKKFCYNCGVEVNPQQAMCVKCGVGLKGGSSGTGGKKKTTAGICAILVGGVGVHKFYHGSWGWGILYILFCWIYIPAILGVIEGIIYLTMDDAKYDDKYNSTENAPFKW